MRIFDEPSKLLNRNFGWGLAPFLPSDLGEDAESEDSSRLVLFIDEEGTVNVSEQLLLYKEADPIDSSTIPTFSKENLFIEGLKKVINPFPTYGVILFPTTMPSSHEVISEGGVFGPIYSAGGSARFPRDTPEGFVPCAGQTLRYPGGGIVVVPNFGPRTITTGAGDGESTSIVSYAPPGGVYMMKVPDGYVEMVPDLNGRDLKDFVSPAAARIF